MNATTAPTATALDFKVADLSLAALIAREDLDVAGDHALGHYTHEKNPVAAAGFPD